MTVHSAKNLSFQMVLDAEGGHIEEEKKVAFLKVFFHEKSIGVNKNLLQAIFRLEAMSI
jgi:hypothetical protein